ncbi:MAG: putative esterase [Verrucomicrobia bacterium]|nr:putative esterase [Verrucomicrobiota bacterium]
MVEAYDLNVGNTGTHLVNVSTRGLVGSGDNVVIAGFAVAGTAPKRLLIRVVGPALSSYGVSDVVNDPLLQLYVGSELVAQNNIWHDDPAVEIESARVGAFPLPRGSTDCSMLVTLMPGNYTVIARSQSGRSGNALVEAYEVPWR